MTVEQLYTLLRNLMDKDVQISDYEVQIGSDCSSVTHVWAIHEMVHGEERIQNVLVIT